MEKEKLEAYIFGGIYGSDSNEPIRIPIKMTNLELLDDIKSGKLIGVSPAFKIREWECSICHQNFELCSHKKGQIYGGSKCQTIIKKAEMIDLSIVD